MLLRRSKNSQSRSVSSISSSLDIKFFPKPANILRLVVDNRKHPAKEEQIARLHRLNIRTKRRRRVWELNARLLQTALCTTRHRTLSAYHRPLCAPPSTCST